MKNIIILVLPFFVIASCALTDQFIYPGGREAAKRSVSSDQNQPSTTNSINKDDSITDGSVEFISIGGKAHVTIDNEYIGVTPIRYKFQCGLFDEYKGYSVTAAPEDKGCDFIAYIQCSKLPKNKILVDIRCRKSNDININLKQTIKK